MKNKKTYSCIIPFYNEGERLLRTVDLISQSREINQIICVDDGSTDHGAQKLRTRFPKITLVRHAINKGKTAAILSGLKKTTGDFVLLLDADLRRLNRVEIDQSIVMMREGKEIDMLILRRIYAPFFTKINRADVLFSGERILRKTDLEKALLQFSPHQFEIEVALNKYMLVHHKIVKWFPTSALNTYKMWKRGFPNGLIEDFKIIMRIFLYVGFVDYMKQILFFGKEKA